MRTDGLEVGACTLIWKNKCESFRSFSEEEESEDADAKSGGGGYVRIEGSINTSEGQSTSVSVGGYKEIFLKVLMLEYQEIVLVTREPFPKTFR